MGTAGITVPTPVMGRSDDRERFEWYRQVGVAVGALMLNSQPRIVAAGYGTLQATDPDAVITLARLSGEQLHVRVSGWSAGTACVVGPPGSDLETRLQSTGVDELTYSLTISNAAAAVAINYEYVVTGVVTAFAAAAPAVLDDPAPFIAGGTGLAVTSTPAVVVAASLPPAAPGANLYWNAVTGNVGWDGLTVYLPVSGGATSQTEAGGGKKILCPRAGTIKNLYVSTDEAPGGSDTTTFIVRKNAVDTTLTAVITGTAATGSDTTHSFTVAAGDYLTISQVETSIVGFHYTFVSVEYAA